RRSPLGPVRPGGDAVRAADGPAAVHGGDAGGEDRADPADGAGEADEVPDVDSEPVRGGGPEAAGEGPGAALPQRHRAAGGADARGQVQRRDALRAPGGGPPYNTLDRSAHAKRVP